MGEVTAIGLGRPRLLFATLMIGLMSQGLAFTAFVAVMPQLARDFGSGGTFIAQMTMALASLGVLAGALTSGSILKQAGTRGTLQCALLVYGLSGISGVLHHSATLLLASRFLLGFASACTVTVCVWGIAAEYQGHRRTVALGTAAACGSFAALFGNLCGAYLASRGGWQLAFVQYPVFALVGIVLAGLSLKQLRPAPSSASTPAAPYLARLMPFYLLTTWLMAVIFMGSSQLPFLLAEQGIVDLAKRSLILGSLTAAGTAFSFLYGPLVKRFGPQKTFAFGLLCAVLSLAALGIDGNALWATAGSILLGALTGIVSPYVYHIVTERSDEGSRGHAIGALNAAIFLGGFLNPLIFGSLGSVMKLTQVFELTAVVMAGFALIAVTQAVRGSARVSYR